MRWIKNLLVKIWKFLVWALTVQDDEENEDIFDPDYFLDIDTDELATKMLPTFVDISKYLNGISSSEITYGIKYFNIEKIEDNNYSTMNRLNEKQKSLCLTKVSTLTDKHSGKREFITTYNIFNKDKNNNLIKITITTYFNSFSFNNKDRVVLLEASTMLVNGFIKIQELNNLTRYSNIVLPFKISDELSRKEIIVSVNTYGEMNDFQQPTLLQYINRDGSNIISQVDMDCKYSCNYIEEASLVFDIIRKDA
jgi:hypothetical protein